MRDRQRSLAGSTLQVRRSQGRQPWTLRRTLSISSCMALRMPTISPDLAECVPAIFFATGAAQFEFQGIATEKHKFLDFKAFLKVLAALCAQ